jgi:hypothetical protein
VTSRRATEHIERLEANFDAKFAMAPLTAARRETAWPIESGIDLSTRASQIHADAGNSEKQRKVPPVGSNGHQLRNARAERDQTRITATCGRFLAWVTPNGTMRMRGLFSRELRNGRGRICVAFLSLASYVLTMMELYRYFNPILTWDPFVTISLYLI